MISLQEFKDELIPVNLYFPIPRSEYYKIYMDEGIKIEDAYEQYIRCLE